MTYMNTGWAGPSPIQVTTAIRDRLDYEDQFGPASPEAIETRDATFLRAKETVAGLINASPQEVLLTQNTTEGVNVVMRHTKAAANVRQAGIVQKEMPLSAANVMLICTSCLKPTRVKRSRLPDGTKARLCRSCEEVIE